ncbi:hypothetical protein LSUE1_G009414 [Lachnellula suecica]|uniref:MADS-box domain-containing protein n=1 Tax=Lachnellula suecica TaxID=602035 RepID=A0A8T9C693_9HELO|nr:hypothetical protein LSUE1_G009414 [Lachnellula suecica]
MAVIPPKRRSERLNRRKFTLINKADELAEFCEVDIALIIRNRKTGRYFTYNSIDLESWPPSKEQIQLSYPTPVNLLPHDMKAKRKKPLKHHSGKDTNKGE